MAARGGHWSKGSGGGGSSFTSASGGASGLKEISANSLDAKTRNATWDAAQDIARGNRMLNQPAIIAARGEKLARRGWAAMQNIQDTLAQRGQRLDLYSVFG